MTTQIKLNTPHIADGKIVEVRYQYRTADGWEYESGISQITGLTDQAWHIHSNRRLVIEEQEIKSSGDDII